MNRATVLDPTRQLRHNRLPESAPRADASVAPRRRWRWIGLAAVVAATIVWQGQQRRPTGPAAGAAFQGTVATAVEPASPEANARRFRVGTFNIHGGKGEDGIRDLPRIADHLSGLDLAGLNEVHGPYLGQSTDQAQRLGELLGVQWLFAPTERRWWHYEFGNGALATAEIEFWQRIPLEQRHGKSHRNVVLLRALLGGEPVNVLIAHIDRSDPRERAEQLRVVGDLFLSLAAPAILMGDLNTDASEAPLRRLLDTPGVRDPVGETLAHEDPRRIDWILTRGLDTIDAGLVHRGASDHPHLWAELETFPAYR